MTNIVVHGIEETQAQIQKSAKALRGPALEKAAKMATMLVTRTAKSPGYVPVDTGRLRASITPQVVARDKVVRGIVGSNVEYAPYQEARKGYLRRALVDNAQRIYQIFKDIIEKTMRK